MRQEDWIKVEDGLPENDDLVLIRCTGIWGDHLIDLYYVGRYVVSMKKWVGDGLFNDCPTHWMPIVSPGENYVC